MCATVFHMSVIEQTVHVSARFPESLADALQERADAEDRPFSYMLRRAVREFVEKDNEPQARKKAA